MNEQNDTDLYTEKADFREFDGCPVVGTLRSHWEVLGSISGQGKKILHAVWHSQKN